MKLSSPVVLILPVLIGALILGGCTAPAAGSAEAGKPAAKKAAPPVKAPAPAAPLKAAAAKPAVAPAAPADVAPKPAAAAPVAPTPPPIPNPAKRPEVLATVDNLTQEGKSNAHELVNATEFPQAMNSLAPGARAPKAEVIYIGTQPPAKGLTADGNSTDLVEKDWTGLVLVPLNTSLSKAHTSAVRLIKVEAHPLSDGRVRIWIRVKNMDGKALPTEMACIFRMHGETTPESPYFYELEVPGQAFRDVFFVSPAGQLETYTVLVRPKFNY